MAHLVDAVAEHPVFEVVHDRHQVIRRDRAFDLGPVDPGIVVIFTVVVGDRPGSSHAATTTFVVFVGLWAVPPLGVLRHQ